MLLDKLEGGHDLFCILVLKLSQALPEADLNGFLDWCPVKDLKKG